jgi:hypothetical protein
VVVTLVDSSGHSFDATAPLGAAEIDPAVATAFA